jgi:hypothetical protein
LQRNPIPISRRHFLQSTGAAASTLAIGEAAPGNRGTDWPHPTIKK